MNKLLSVVVPTYNMEKYLRRCLDSLIVSDKGDKRLEVIVINDGSKDSSLQIAYEYKNNYPEIIRVVDKENGNYGSCINRGIEVSSGEYFRILDADDFFYVGALKKLLDYIENFVEKPDLIITNYQKENSNGYIKQYKNEFYKYNRIYRFENVDFNNSEDNYIPVMHRMTYRLDVIKEVGLRHLEGISYTDSEYCFYPLRAVKKIIFLDLLLYRYQVGMAGQTVSIKSLQRNIHDNYLILDRMLSSFHKEEKSEAYYKNMICVMRIKLYVYYTTILTGRFKHSEDLKSMDERIKYFDCELYNSLSSFKKAKIIPVVSLWRRGFKTNNYLFTLFWGLFEKTKKMIRTI